MIKLKVKRLSKRAIIPSYARENDSGLDLMSVERVVIPSGESRLIKTGIEVELPPWTEGQVRPKSGLSKRNINVSFGTIDNGYRGEIMVQLRNNSNIWFTVEPGMKIAQLVICPVFYVQTEEVDELTHTDRGCGGFGHTGLMATI